MANLVAGHSWFRGTPCLTPMPLAPKHRLNVAGLVVDGRWPSSKVAALFQVSSPTVARSHNLRHPTMPGWEPLTHTAVLLVIYCRRLSSTWVETGAVVSTSGTPVPAPAPGRISLLQKPGTTVAGEWQLADQRADQSADGDGEHG